MVRVYLVAILSGLVLSACAGNRFEASNSNSSSDGQLSGASSSASGGVDASGAVGSIVQGATAGSTIVTGTKGSDAGKPPGFNQSRAPGEFRRYCLVKSATPPLVPVTLSTAERLVVHLHQVQAGTSGSAVTTTPACTIDESWVKDGLLAGQDIHGRIYDSCVGQSATFDVSAIYQIRIDGYIGSQMNSLTNRGNGIGIDQSPNYVSQPAPGEFHFTWQVTPEGYFSQPGSGRDGNYLLYKTLDSDSFIPPECDSAC